MTRAHQTPPHLSILDGTGRQRNLLPTMRTLERLRRFIEILTNGGVAGLAGVSNVHFFRLSPLVWGGLGRWRSGAYAAVPPRLQVIGDAQLYRAQGLSRQ